MLRRTVPLFGSAAGRVAVGRAAAQMRMQTKKAVEIVGFLNVIIFRGLQTDSAALRLRELLQQRPEAAGIRLGLQKRACPVTTFVHRTLPICRA
jgi:hypothetical protein